MKIIHNDYPAVQPEILPPAPRGPRFTPPDPKIVLGALLVVGGGSISGVLLSAASVVEKLDALLATALASPLPAIIILAMILSPIWILFAKWWRDTK